MGIGMGFGMMILVIANSFSHGMVDVLIKDVVSNVFGHLVIQSRPGNSYYSMIRDREHVEKIIRETIKKEDLVRYDESLGMFGRAVGNGETDNVVIVGVAAEKEKDKKAFFNGFFTLVDGNYDEYFSKEIEYPVIISEQKAKSLNVKLHDMVRVRLPMVTGQVQAAKLTVVAIANANNTFMDICLFMEAERVKKLLGYKPWESASFQITLKNPKQTSKYYADILYKKLQPGIISIAGDINHQSAELLAFKNLDEAKEALQKKIKIVAGDAKEALGKNGVMLASPLAKQLGLNVGSEFNFEYQTKFRGLHEEKYKVNAIYESATKLGGNVVLLNGEKIYETFDKFLPVNRMEAFIDQKDSLYPVLATTWKLLERSADSTSLMKKMKREQRVKTSQTKIDVMTMYEGASQILSFEGVLNMVTIIAVLVLFFIILIGVINTLRMTIRERTREIGTVRAIGMQRKDVRNMFIIETLQLTAISCLAGIIIGMIVMWILSLIRFDVNNALSMILKDKHLYFKLNPLALLFNFLLIMLISGVTAYFPAKRAAKLSAVEALRHYE